MGKGIENAPAPDGQMPTFSCWEIDVRMYDDSGKQVDAFTCRQDLWVGVEDKQFVVRLTRKDDAGAQYEERAALDDAFGIKGNGWFGGTLDGKLTKSNAFFLEGKGDSTDFMLVATQTGPKHYRCFRRFHVKQPGKLWGTQVSPGTYYVTTEDQMLEGSEQPPAELRTPLKQPRQGASQSRQATQHVTA